MSTKKASSFIGDVNYIESPVRGEDVQFHPISVKAMFKLKRVAKPLAKALAVLFAPTAQDTGVTQRQFSDGAETGTETVSQAISPKLAEFRSTERASAIEILVDAVTDPKNADVLGGLISDSCREIDFEGSSPGAFVGDLHMPTLVEFIKGLAKANAEVLGPLGGRVQEAVKAAGDALETKATAG